MENNEQRDAALLCVMKRACWIVGANDMCKASSLLDDFEALLAGADPMPYLEAEAVECERRFKQFIGDTPKEEAE